MSIFFLDDLKTLMQFAGSIPEHVAEEDVAAGVRCA